MRGVHAELAGVATVGRAHPVVVALHEAQLAQEVEPHAAGAFFGVKFLVLGQRMRIDFAADVAHQAGAARTGAAAGSAHTQLGSIEGFAHRLSRGHSQ